ncbi:hypothetical protein [Chlorogloea sp. CCALA 695]|nr:hypothetical protein [Chlorogloea sp. CCALA 695]
MKAQFLSSVTFIQSMFQVKLPLTAASLGLPQIDEITLPQRG